MRTTWFQPLTELLEETGLPRGSWETVQGQTAPIWSGINHILVEGEVTFPKPATPKGPDQGNFRGPLEKMLGDVLEEGGWLPNDNWQCYEFGGLAYRHEPGVSRTRLIIFPRI